MRERIDPNKRYLVYFLPQNYIMQGMIADTGGDWKLYMKSKAPFVAKGEPVDIVGFYSEHHAGVFLTQFAPAIKEGSGMQNAIHIHLVSKTSKAAGHIDDIVLGEGMVLRLPKQ